MNKKYVIAIISIIAVVCLIYLWKKTPVTTPAAEPLQVPQTQDQVTATSSTAVTVPTTPVTGTKTVAPSSVSGTTVTTPTMTKDGSYIVTYTTNGFTPVRLQINAGKSVHFVNNSNKAMSITSVDQNDPVHGELSQSGVVGRGGSYDFTFLTAGFWVYANRNDSADQGIIVVVK